LTHNSQEYIQKAAKLSIYFQEYMIGEIEKIIDEEQKVKHTEIAKKIESILENEAEIKKLESKCKV